jgi:hypothetical protein
MAFVLPMANDDNRVQPGIWIRILNFNDALRCWPKKTFAQFEDGKKWFPLIQRLPDVGS